MKRILIVDEPRPGTSELLKAFAKIGIDVIRPDSGNHLTDAIEAIEIKALEELSAQDNYIPEPKKGIAQKAQWASKPYRRKR